MVGRTEVKLNKSLGRLKSVKERSKDWETVNGEKRRKKKSGDDEEDVDDGMWVDEVIVMQPLAVPEQAGSEQVGELEPQNTVLTTVAKEPPVPSEKVADDIVDDIL